LIIDKHIYFDLDLNEVAMILHAFLKKFSHGMQTINFHVEEVTYDNSPEDSEVFKTVDKYTLIIIASRDKITKKELMKIFDDMMKNSMMSRSRC
jgi:tagatose-1,6-bisphosphate aldolase